MRFDRVVVVGTGRVAVECIRLVRQRTDRVAAVEAERNQFSTVQSVCERDHIEYAFWPDRATAAAALLAVTRPSLIVSAHNSLIFPAAVIDNPALTMVNFHNSLLPKHAGRNAPSWAIYEQDRIAGITWHRISPRVDEGDVFAQESTPIDEHDTGMSLTRKCVDLGLRAFDGIIDRLLAETITPNAQIPDPRARLHRASEVPNDGRLDPTWDFRQMSAFLRAMDHGKFPVFPQPKVHLAGHDRLIRGYAFGNAENRMSASWEATPFDFDNEAPRITVFLDPLD